MRKEKLEPKYLLESDKRQQNEYFSSDKTARQMFNEELEKIKNRRGLKPQFDNCCWEAVVNLNANHHIEDVKQVARHIETKFNIRCYAGSIHRDEGHVDKETGETKYNYHAHLCFFTLQDGKQMWRKEHIKPQQLRELQTEIATILEMERGKNNSQTVRLEHKEYRAEVQSKEAEKELIKRQQEQLKKENLTLKEQKNIIEAERKKYKAEGEHIAEEYRKLQALNKTMHTQEELEQALKELRNEYKKRLGSAIEKIKKSSEITPQIIMQSSTFKSMEKSKDETINRQVDEIITLKENQAKLWHEKQENLTLKAMLEQQANEANIKDLYQAFTYYSDYDFSFKAITAEELQPKKLGLFKKESEEDIAQRINARVKAEIDGHLNVFMTMTKKAYSFVTHYFKKNQEQEQKLKQNEQVIYNLNRIQINTKELLKQAEFYIDLNRVKKLSKIKKFITQKLIRNSIQYLENKTDIELMQEMKMQTKTNKEQEPTKPKSRGFSR